MVGLVQHRRPQSLGGDAVVGPIAKDAVNPHVPPQAPADPRRCQKVVVAGSAMLLGAVRGRPLGKLVEGEIGRFQDAHNFVKPVRIAVVADPLRQRQLPQRRVAFEQPGERRGHPPPPTGRPW
jgi:hypothetical protein